VEGERNDRAAGGEDERTRGTQRTLAAGTRTFRGKKNLQSSKFHDREDIGPGECLERQVKTIGIVGKKEHNGSGEECNASGVFLPAHGTRNHKACC